MATKAKKAQTITKKSTAKKIGATKKTSTAKKATAKAKVTKKKATKAPRTTTAKKTTNIKKSVPKKVVVAKKTAASKKAITKKSVVKETAAKKTIVKKATSDKKSNISKKNAVVSKNKPIKKIATTKKIVKETKKAITTAKVVSKKPVQRKPNLKIVVSNKEKIETIPKIGIINKPVEKLKTVVNIEPIEKGVKKRIMESLEVKPIKPSTAGLFGVAPYEEKPGEEYMNESQKNHFREILRRWKKDLMEEVDRTKSHMQQDGATRHPDPSDNATQEEEFTLELRTRDRERKLIKKIDESLERIDQDDYGYCDACGIEIGIRRLEARPTAEMCIDCKTLDEIKEKQTRG